MSVGFFSTKQPWGYLEMLTHMKTESEAVLCLSLQAKQFTYPAVQKIFNNLRK